MDEKLKIYHINECKITAHIIAVLNDKFLFINDYLYNNISSDKEYNDIIYIYFKIDKDYKPIYRVHINNEYILYLLYHKIEDEFKYLLIRCNHTYEQDIITKEIKFIINKDTKKTCNLFDDNIDLLNHVMNNSSYILRSNINFYLIQLYDYINKFLSPYS